MKGYTKEYVLNGEKYKPIVLTEINSRYIHDLKEILEKLLDLEYIESKDLVLLDKTTEKTLLHRSEV